jgi:tRNA U38,U39,U40 pseudouridine synthase TruA
MISKIIELGIGKIDFVQFQDLFNPNLDISYQPADPEGLILWDINYGDNIHFMVDPKSIERRQKFFSEQEVNHKLKYKLFSILQHYDSC